MCVTQGNICTYPYPTYPFVLTLFAKCLKYILTTFKYLIITSFP